MRWLRQLLGLGLGAVLVGACTPARKEVDGNIVRSVHFEGNGGLGSGHNDLQLRGQMEQGSSKFGLLTWPFIYTVDPVVYQAELLPRDAYRLEVWYAHRGWFDAKVVGWELQRLRNTTDKRAGVLDIQGVVEPGEPSVLRSLTLEGLDKNLAVLGNAVLRTAPISEGDQFDLDLVDATAKLLADKLHNLSRAYAKVKTTIDVDADAKAVDVVLHVEPGISARYGEITITGNKRIPSLYIEQNLTVEQGDAYSLDALKQSQRRLFEMSTFSVVTVEPDLSDPTSETVPLKVTVSEAKWRSFRIGAGLDYDGFLLAPRVSTRLRHVNLFNQLMRAEFGASAGLAYDVSVGDTPESIPTWRLTTSLAYPRIAQQRVALELKGSYEQDVYSGLWAYRRPEADLHVVWKYTDEIQLRAGPHVEQYTFIGDYGPGQEIAQSRLFGIDASEGFRYQLTSLDQFVTWDWRNDPVRTTRGSYYTLQLREAIPLSESGYFFIGTNMEARRYVPVRFRRGGRAAFPVVAVGKVRGQVIQPIGDSQIPLPERAFLGGANSLRGFRTNQVGPYETLCTYDNVTRGGTLFGGGEQETVREVTHYHLPSGGQVAAETSAELRYNLDQGIVLAGFADVGILAPNWAELGLDDLRYSFGVGARYDTLVGPIRFDLSFRPLFPEDAGPDRWRRCDPADLLAVDARVYDFLSNFRGLRGDAHPPFATVFFLTIGESI
jgi:outer membrane protein assembly factor BamA